MSADLAATVILVRFIPLGKCELISSNILFRTLCSLGRFSVASCSTSAVAEFGFSIMVNVNQ